MMIEFIAGSFLIAAVIIIATELFDRFVGGGDDDETKT